MKRLVLCEEVSCGQPLFHKIPGRSGHRIVCIDGDIYVVGGYVQESSGLSVLGDVWCFNTVAKLWRRLNLQRFPYHEALSSSVIADGNQIIIHGGTGIPFATRINNTVLVLDVVSETWDEFPCEPEDGLQTNVPIGSYGHSLNLIRISRSNWESRALSGTYLIRIGGALGSEYLNHVYAFSFNTKKWEKLFGSLHNSLHEDFAGRYRHDAVYWKEEMYIVGGVNNDGSFPLWPMPVFNMQRREWRSLSFNGERPSPLRYHCSVQYENQIFVTGGSWESNGHPNNLILCLDLEKQVFYKVGVRTHATYFHDLALDPFLPQFYSFGGVNATGSRVGNLHCMRLLAPISVPPLTELAWHRYSTAYITPFYQPKMKENDLVPTLRSASAHILRLRSLATSPQTPLCPAFSIDHFGFTVGDRTDGGGTVEDHEETFFHNILSLHTVIWNSYCDERKSELYASVTMFIVLLFYFTENPLMEYLKRLPHGKAVLASTLDRLRAMKQVGRTGVSESQRGDDQESPAPA